MYLTYTACWEKVCEEWLVYFAAAQGQQVSSDLVQDSQVENNVCEQEKDWGAEQLFLHHCKPTGYLPVWLSTFSCQPIVVQLQTIQRASSRCSHLTTQSCWAYNYLTQFGGDEKKTVDKSVYWALVFYHNDEVK